MTRNKLQNAAYISVISAAIAAAVYLFARHILPSLLPILLAYMISEAIKPLAGFMHRYAHVKPKVTSLAAVFAAVMIVWQLGGAVFGELTDELEAFAENASAYLEAGTAPVRKLIDRANDIHARLPAFLKSSSGDKADIFDELLKTATAEAAERAGQLAEAMLISLPRFLFSIFTFAISLYYFCCDPHLLGKLSAMLPPAASASLARLKDCAITAARSYGRAYFIIMLINIAILSTGFALIGIAPALLLGVVISAADLLPVIGIGTVLLPWAICALLLGNSFRGISLLALYFTATFIRQLLEPRLIGKATGLHPLLSLVISYVSLRLLGLWGMLFAPFIASFAFEALKREGTGLQGSKNNLQ